MSITQYPHRPDDRVPDPGRVHDEIRLAADHCRSRRALRRRSPKVCRLPTRPSPNWPSPTSASSSQLSTARNDAAKRLADAERLAQADDRRSQVACQRKRAPRSFAAANVSKPSRPSLKAREGPARAGRCAGRQGRRADPQARSERRRSRRVAVPPARRNSEAWPRLATIARPYAEALFKACWLGRRRRPWSKPGRCPRSRHRRPCRVRQFADSPKVQPKQVFELVRGVAKVALSPKVANLLLTA